MRALAGIVAKDLPRYVRALAPHRERGYLSVCNRGERLMPAPVGDGMRCDWRWTSDLHAPRHLPALGTWVMRRALADHPVRSAASPMCQGEAQVCFVIGHRGEERLPLLLATLGSIAAQEGARIECIVVQQERDNTLAGRLPAWVRLVHTPPPGPSMPFCRSWAFNVGGMHATAPVLVLHDNDMLVPAGYASQVLAHMDSGWDAVNLKRFVFYLDEAHSSAYLRGSAGLLDRPPLAITQNLEGGSVAITREAFERIGGMDESFVGWGGEDNEFWERAATLRAWTWGELSLVHLWHAAQPGKHDAANPMLAHYRSLSSIPVQERIAILRQRKRGRMDGPCVDEPQLVEEAR